jgi:chloride channel 7
MEEGASHWSAATTIKAFVCAMIAMLTVNLVFAESSFGTTNTQSVFVFGEFINLKAGETNYRMWELFLFMFIGVTGGIMGGYFNRLVQFVTVKNFNDPNVRRMQYLRIFGYTILMVLVSFILPAIWQKCDKIPSGAETAGMSQEELDLLDDLVQFQCKDGEYNQLASLYFVPAEVAMKQLFHFREYDGTGYQTFGFGPLFLFFVPYILICGFLNGIPVPMGLFIPTLLAGATYGRIWGHFLNRIASGSVADAGTYALVGAAALNGGVTRITISMTIIMLETTGNMTYLLPLMLTFICARYSANAISTGLYNILIYVKDIPYIRDNVKSLGLLNHVAVSEIMAQPVVTLNLSEKVEVIYKILKEKTHNGFPVVDSRGRFVGLILRKTLCSLLELKAFSKVLRSEVGSNTDSARSSGIVLDLPERTIFYEVLEKKYPDFTTIDQIHLNSTEMVQI